MGSRRTARVLAPLALVASALAVYVIVAPAGSGGGSDEPAPSTTAVRTTTTPSTTTGTTARPSTGPASVEIQPGDTLSAIAERTGVSVARLQELNEDVDAQALRAGDRLRLRP